MLTDEIEPVLGLKATLGPASSGRPMRWTTISQRVETARAGLENPSKPKGVFLLVGPSGVGKTETALALAEQLYGGEDHVITINMSEFQEAHTVSTLKGAPPGYVGYGEGGGSPRPCAASPTASCSWTRSRRRTPTSTSSSSRSSTRA